MTCSSCSSFDNTFTQHLQINTGELKDTIGAIVGLLKKQLASAHSMADYTPKNI